MDSGFWSAVAVAAIGAFTTIFNVIYTNKKSAKKKEDADNEALRNGVQCLLRAEIIRAHEKYNQRKFCPIYAKESATRAYKAYNALGGNDVATELYEDLMRMSDTPPTE